MGRGEAWAAVSIYRAGGQEKVTKGDKQEGAQQSMIFDAGTVTSCVSAAMAR